MIASVRDNHALRSSCSDRLSHDLEQPGGSVVCCTISWTKSGVKPPLHVTVLYAQGSERVHLIGRATKTKTIGSGLY